MTPDYEKPVAAAIDYLETRPDVDSNKIAIFGSSLGGFITARAASLEKRVKACVSLCPFYSYGEFERPLPTRLTLTNAMKITLDEWPEKRKLFTLEGVIDKMTCPLLVANSSEDQLLPRSQAMKVYEKACCPKDLKMWEGFGHCGWCNDRSILYEIADWIRDKLQKGMGK